MQRMVRFIDPFRKPNTFSTWTRTNERIALPRRMSEASLPAVVRAFSSFVMRRRGAAISVASTIQPPAGL